MTKTFQLAALTSLFASIPAFAGVDSNIEVYFELQFEADSLGTVTLGDTFDATESLDAGVYTLKFGGNGAFATPGDPSATFSYTDLSVLFVEEDIDGDGMASLTNGSSIDYDFTFSGFGDAWDGSFASGVGYIEFTQTGGFTVESHDITWSVTLVPAPGAVALLGLAGLTSRRRRD
ncbi:MAG: hypothetical protein VX672_06745 [Planctomycetota bacterium]|nr:hypothetical protein [Planctomycetota bacterium]